MARNNAGFRVCRSGLAQVAFLGGLAKSTGEVLTLLASGAGCVGALNHASRISGGRLYRSISDSLRRSFNNYDAYLSDPYYYDPYRRNAGISCDFESSVTTTGTTTADGRILPDGYVRPRVDSAGLPIRTVVTKLTRRADLGFE